jgi:hypothetical protein
MFRQVLTQPRSRKVGTWRGLGIRSVPAQTVGLIHTLACRAELSCRGGSFFFLGVAPIVTVFSPRWKEYGDGTFNITQSTSQSKILILHKAKCKGTVSRYFKEDMHGGRDTIRSAAQLGLAVRLLPSEFSATKGHSMELAGKLG